MESLRRSLRRSAPRFAPFESCCATFLTYANFDARFALAQDDSLFFASWLHFITRYPFIYKTKKGRDPVTDSVPFASGLFDRDLLATRAGNVDLPFSLGNTQHRSAMLAFEITVGLTVPPFVFL